jgi:hypothetical protein
MKLYAAPRDDVSEGHVWLEQADLPPRCIVKITNTACAKSVYCEALQFDSNFLKDYNDSSRHIKIDSPQSSIVMSYWYRARLGGLETQKDYPLSIKKAWPVWGALRSGVGHPQTVVRFAIWLSVLSVFLGLVGLFLGVLGIVAK